MLVMDVMTVVPVTVTVVVVVLAVFVVVVMGMVMIAVMVVVVGSLQTKKRRVSVSWLGCVLPQHQLTFFCLLFF